VFHPDGVEVYVDTHRSGRPVDSFRVGAGEVAVHVWAVVEDLVECDLGPEAIGLFSNPTSEFTLTPGS
jgi:hypothetical protein